MNHRTGHDARRSHARFVVRPLFAALVASGVVAPAHGATINVITGGDAGTGSTCTVRQAVASLNAGALQDGCALASGAFGANDTVDLNLRSGTIGLVSGPLMPTVPMTFDGPGATTLAISGQGASRVVEGPMGQVAIDGLTISNGLSVGPGGCIFVDDLILTDSVVTGCRATSSGLGPFADGIGGGIAAKYLNSYRSTIVGNTADTSGGGVFSYGGQFTQTLVTGNTVARSVCATPEAEECIVQFLGGGGILGATVLTLGSTVSGNTVNASQFTKYDDANQPYNVNIGFGGGITQIPLGFYTNPNFTLTAKSGMPRKAIAMFGPDARKRTGPAKAALKAKLAAVRSAGPRNKADGFVDSGLGLAFSTVSGNRVTGNRAAEGKYAGGGAFALSIYYNVEVASSTISGNRLDVPAGTYAPGSALLTTFADISNSTITGNVGSIAVAMQNFYSGTPGFGPAAAAKRGTFSTSWSKWQKKLGTPVAKAAGRNKDITAPVFDSTIIATNGAALYDLSCGSGCTIGGSNNLIRLVDNSTTVPPDTLTSDPQLAPLANNGGILTGAPGHSLTLPMPTHLLFAGSPAVDGGSNPEGFTFDQRGDGFPRVVGGGPDIGALEGVAPRPDLPVPALAPWLVAMLSALLGVLGLRSRRRSA